MNLLLIEHVKHSAEHLLHLPCTRTYPGLHFVQNWASNGWVHCKHDVSQAAHVYISLEYIVPNGQIFWQVDFVLGVEQD
jgi:hypothetical protein